MNLSPGVSAGALLLLTALVLGACSTTPYDPANIKPRYEVRNSPVPVPRPRIKPKAPARMVAVATSRPSSTSGTTVVRRGDTVYAIARRHGVTPRSLIDTNRLRSPYRLAVGQKLTIPGTAKHRVARGETLYGISRAYGVDMTSLARHNGLGKPYRLSVGQTLAIPGGGSRFAGTGAGSQSSTVKKTAVPAPPPRQGGRFAWPIKGRIVSGFGPKGEGLHNDGINIRAAAGTQVRAADAGVVAYAGDELEGFGQLLLIKHADGWVTAYAHNQKLLVSRGMKVKRGQMIALVGSSGNVASPQLHFEIRRRTQAVNPIKYMDAG